MSVCRTADDRRRCSPKRGLITACSRMQAEGGNMQDLSSHCAICMRAWRRLFDFETAATKRRYEKKTVRKTFIGPCCEESRCEVRIHARDAFSVRLCASLKNRLQKLKGPFGWRFVATRLTAAARSSKCNNSTRHMQCAVNSL